MDNHKKNNWKYYSASAAYLIITWICWDTPRFMGWYDTLLGEQGLKNVIAIVRMSVVTGCVLTIPLMIMVFCASMAVFLERKIFGVLMFIIGTALSAALSVSVSSSICHFNIQCQKIGIDSSMQNFKLMNACIQDLKNDEYEKYTINDTSTFHQLDSFRTANSGFYERGVNLMLGKESILKVQIGRSEYDRFNEKPLSGFDGAVTVYKNSGFLRSYKPSVEYTKEEAGEHIFTVYVEDGKIYCKQNSEPRNPGGCYLWAGYRKGEITDYFNYILDEDISDTDPFDIEMASYYFNKENGSFYTSDDLDQICICLRKGDFSCERVSNIISLDDYGIIK